MKFFDENFKAQKIKYILQCALTTAVVLAVLLVLRSVTETVMVAALGASAFIAFTMPHKEVSKPRFLIGRYLIGTVAGCVCNLLSGYYLLTDVSFVHKYSDQIFGSISVGTAIFSMTITNTEHPPAAEL